MLGKTDRKRRLAGITGVTLVLKIADFSKCFHLFYQPFEAIYISQWY
jgi:hypothetical protein